MRGRVVFTFALAGIISVFAWGEEEENGGGFDEGRWRLELAAVPWAGGNPADRDGDYYFMGSAEYEFPVFHRSTLGLRLMPLFYYYEEEDPGGSEGSIFGAGLGAKYRMYYEAETRSGLFLDLGISVIGHDSHFEGNSEHFNFLSEGGLGYQFRDAPWNLGVRYTHISNAALGSENKEINGVAFAIGYRF